MKVSKMDEITMLVLDIVQLEGEMWGNVYPNGSSTGLNNYLIEDKIDLSSLQHFCGMELHPNLLCSRYT